MRFIMLFPSTPETAAMAKAKTKKAIWAAANRLHACTTRFPLFTEGGSGGGGGGDGGAEGDREGKSKARFMDGWCVASNG
jgi:hypothetical protein